MAGGQGGAGWIFQSTPPARGATAAEDAGHGNRRNFNPRPPRGGRLIKHTRRFLILSFQSTPPARGATGEGMSDKKKCPFCISIHAPREGGDKPLAISTRRTLYFNPRPPRGGRRADIVGKCHSYTEFQSTPPARGATEVGHRLSRKKAISIHAPREGGDTRTREISKRSYIFQSTPPARGATVVCIAYRTSSIFQSTPPARGATPGVPRPSEALAISIHAPREGGDSGRSLR